MYTRAIYEGNDTTLQSMASFNISQDALDVVEKMGSERFIILARRGDIVDKLATQFVGWVMDCPELARDYLFKNIPHAEIGDETIQLNGIALNMRINDMEGLIVLASQWYNQAPMMIHFIIEKALADTDVRNENPFIIGVIENYIKEAVDVARYAEII